MGTNSPVNPINRKTRIIRTAAVLFVLSILLGCRMESGGGNTPNTLTWTGAWENDTEFYGTFTITMTLEGENMDFYGGEGSVSGTIDWKGFDGSTIVASSLAGTWENNRSTSGNVPHDLFEFTIESADSRLALSAHIHYETAAEINNGTWEMSSFTLDGESGSWHTNPGDGITLLGEGGLEVTSALTLDTNSTVEFLDITYVGSSGRELYAAILDDSEYKIIGIDISNGSVDEIGISCAEPFAVTFEEPIHGWSGIKAPAPD